MRGGAYFAASNGTEIYYSSEGAGGIPMLLIHGWTCDQNDWSFQIPFLLSLGFWVIAMDLRGHGHSLTTANLTQFDPISMANDAVALLNHLGVDGNNSTNKAIVAGHSLGGVLVNELALRHPHLIRGIVSVDSAAYMTPDTMQQITQALRAAGPGGAAVAATDLWDAGGLLPKDAPVWVRPWQQRRAWAVEGRVVTDTFAQLAEHLGPGGVEYLRRTRGTEGRTIPRLVTCAVDGSAEIEREAGLDARLDRVEVVPGGHFHHVLSPDRFNALLKEWFTEREWIK
ncbi:uncharacterized protein PpBr36_09534 [Pyricularia pennisetigena]|uniref:uncharacterized protein n=1 Tax=Pyricularia pennisetigena TaxID=1578925 RepID=UPI0011521893|nr:uncharacterized protein PpBr36_09534 [Pyricularia pennisetigena]TLS22037.1 hypothetical protein PpBr36_09534 [Pyricularia pennisetigena]